MIPCPICSCPLQPVARDSEWGRFALNQADALGHPGPFTPAHLGLIAHTAMVHDDD